MKKISVIGAGSWGTALACLLNDNQHNVTIWSIDKNEVEMLTTYREQKEKLAGVKVADEIKITADLKEALTDKDIVVMAVPSIFVRSTAKKMAEVISGSPIIVNVAKGIEENTLMTLTDIIKEELPGYQVAVLSGPSHAEEVGRKIPTTCVVGSSDKETCEILQDVFMNQVFRVYTSSDVLGIELGGALKNVIALAAGINDGLGYGDNSKAALMTRGIAEISRLGVKMGAKMETFYGLSGIGDLIVTCSSKHSRNRNAGYYIGKGMSYEEAMKEVKMVVEGVYSAKAAYALSKKYDSPLPIIEQVNKVLFEQKAPTEAVTELFLRDKKMESGTNFWN
ncbi:MAG: NAD(P)H-dependent glycerol-3-phosphate dehydrogenase [Lachnospiraceae bacterium]|nr:NAD(P)H-dependent glycerol-3-phosphate dehydrogenase [Lachnospiraceae bacterium]